jgi:hypothetical protein
MELTLKVQKIPENPIVEGNCITLTHEFEVPDETHLKKRGKLFITMSIEASQDFDLENIAKLFIENLKENFYRITEDTPLHCIEKALSRAHKIIQTVKSRDERINLLLLL